MGRAGGRKGSPVKRERKGLGEAETNGSFGDYENDGGGGGSGRGDVDGRGGGVHEGDPWAVPLKILRCPL